MRLICFLKAKNRIATRSILLLFILFANTSFGQWTEIGNPTTIGNVGGSTNRVRSFTMEMVNGFPWVATTDWDGSRLSVKRYNGSTWEFVGSMFQTTSPVRELDMTTDGANVYVAYINQPQPNTSLGGSMTVRKYSISDNSWTTVGSNTIMSNVGSPKIAITSNGQLTLTCRNLDQDSLGQVETFLFLNSSWSILFATPFTADAIFDTYTFDNDVYLSYRTAVNGVPTAKTRKFVNSWVDTNRDLTGFIGNPSFKVLNGEFYVAHAANGSGPIVKKFNGSTWVTLGTPDNHSTDIFSVNLSFLNNLPIITYEYTEGFIGVQKYNGTFWEIVPLYAGQNNIAYNGPNGVLPIVGTQGNTIYIGYRSYGGEPTVKRYESVPALQAIPTYTSIDATSGTLEATVLGQGAATITQRGFVFAKKSDNANPLLNGQDVTNYVDASATTGTFTKVVTGLLSNTEYAFKAYATNSFGTSYSNVFYFSTNQAPTLQTLAGVGVTTFSVPENSTAITTMIATDTDIPAQTLTFGLSNSPIALGHDSGRFSINPTTGELTFRSAPNFEFPDDNEAPQNEYKLIVTVTDNGNPNIVTSLPLTVNVTNVPEIPSVDNASATLIGITGANLRASIITNGGGGAITQRGFVYAISSTNNDPIIGGNGVTTVNSTDVIANFSSVISGLTANTNYTFKAFATNATGTSYTNSVNFATLTTNTGPVLIYPNPIFVETGALMNPIAPQNVGSAIPEGTFTRVSPFIGSGSEGNLNSTNPLLAELNAPMGMVQVENGDIYFADQYNHRIKKYDAVTGAITQIAGATTPTPFATSASGSNDGVGIGNARFNSPAGMTYDGAGNLYVADWENNKIRRIVISTGAVTTIAGGGTGSTSGYTNANGTAARFLRPTDVKFRQENNVPYLYVADAGNHAIRRINLTDNSVTTFAGINTSGSTEGSLTNARFNLPVSLVFSNSGVMYVVDRGNNKIRKIENNQVSTFAGSGTNATTDGAGAGAAFSDPWGIEIDGAGNLYISQASNGSAPTSNPGFGISASTNNFIRKISPNGQVTNFAGTGARGAIDNANGLLATFASPTALLIDNNKQFLYVCEWFGDKIRKIEITGYTISAPMPSGLSFDAINGTISGTPSSNAVTTRTVCGYNYNGAQCVQFTINAVTLPSITTSSVSSITATSAVAGATISDAGGSTISERGICWSTTATPTISNNKIVDSATTIGAFTSTITGLTSSTTYYVRAYTITNIGVAYGQEISFTTTVAAPSISYPASATLQVGTAITPIQVTNTGGAVIIGDSVTTFAGNGSNGFLNATGTNASFSFNYNYIVSDSKGNLFVTDAFNHAIRKITPEGIVSTFAGGTNGTADGIGTNAQFYQPRGIAIDSNDVIYVSEGSHRIRKILPNGTVTTLAGPTFGASSSNFGFVNGSGINARFANPAGLFVDVNNNIYVADTSNHTIRKITPDGTVSTLAGLGIPGNSNGDSTVARFNQPLDLVMDNQNNLYVVDYGNNVIRKITPDGNVTTFAGSTQGFSNGPANLAKFSWPTSIDIDSNGNFLVTDLLNSRIRRVTPLGDVATFAGSGVGTSVANDSSLMLSTFSNIFGILLNQNGEVFVISNNRVRKIVENIFYTISPTLPQGLVLNGNGSISGTPTQYSPVTNYTITATNAGGSSSAVIALGVDGPNQWTGAVSTAWDNPANWLKNVVPTSTDDVDLIGGMPNQPTLNVDFTVGAGKTLRMLGPNNTFCQLTVAPGKTLTIDGTADIGQMSVIFKSDATGSGMLGKISGTLLPNNNGSTYVERYIPAKRAYRFLSTSVNSVAIIQYNWQSSNGPGYGTHITGPGGATNGFDVTETNNPSMFTFNHDSQNWSAVPNTNTLATKLIAGRGYRLMVRGDRTISMDTNTPTPTNTVLTSHGVIFQGNFTPTLNQNAGGFSFIGNPYQAIVDMEAVLSSATNIENQYYYIWDPTINVRGAYVAVGVQNGVNNNPSSVATKYLQPGQAFFIKNTSSMSAAPSLTMTENHKATVASNPSLFRNASNEISNGVLKLTLENNNNQILDAITLLFNENASNEVDQNDASRLTNLDEELAIQKSTAQLTVEHRNYPLVSEIIDLSVTKYRGINYVFKASLQNYEGSTPFLLDTFSNTYTQLFNGQEVNYSFVVNEGSNTTDRFKIVFQNTTLSTDDFANNIKLYPNPAKAGASFYLDGITEATVSVYNVVGQNIPVTVMSQGNTTQVTPTAALSQGVYLITVTTAGKTAQVKWIVE